MILESNAISVYKEIAYTLIQLILDLKSLALKVSKAVLCLGINGMIGFTELVNGESKMKLWIKLVIIRVGV